MFMAKLVNRLSAAEARAKATDVNALLNRVYERIKDAAENNEFYTWFYFWTLKREMVIEVVKDLRKNGYEVELFEEEETEVDETVERPRGDEVLNALLGIKKEKEEEKENIEENTEEEAVEEDFKWRDIRISWK